MSEGSSMAPADGADSGAAEEHAPAARPQRPFPLAILLAVYVASNLASGIAGLLSRERMFQEIPKLTPALYYAWLIAPPVGIAGAIGLWFLRRWGLIAIAASWLIVAVVDFRLGATAHGIIATGIMWLIFLFSRPIRAALR